MRMLKEGEGGELRSDMERERSRRALILREKTWVKFKNFEEQT